MRHVATQTVKSAYRNPVKLSVMALLPQVAGHFENLPVYKEPLNPAPL